MTQQDQRIYFRQLLAGRDFAQQDPAAKMMQNFVYLIGDRVTRLGTLATWRRVHGLFKAVFVT